jgi:tellurite resistance protein
MEQLLIPTLVVMIIAMAVYILSLADRTGSSGVGNRSILAMLQDWMGRFMPTASHKTDPTPITESFEQPDQRVLNCRIQLSSLIEDNCFIDAFTVQIVGTIYAPTDMHQATLQIFITDITDEVHNSEPIHSRVKEWQMKDSPVFCYRADLGKLPHKTTILSDWTNVAQLHINWLTFPQRGTRNLKFSLSILSQKTGQELASAVCAFPYDNLEYGYIDLHENIQRTRTLAVSLAFAVSAVDGRLYDCEIEIIKEWARNNLDISNASEKARQKVEKALNNTVAFFSQGNQLDTYKVCQEIVETVPLAERYDILDLCLRVAQANGVASAEEIALLKNLANWLEVDMNRFRGMVEKILPIGMHEVRDEEVILGVSADMSREKTRQQLNREYSKWNSRVTSSNPEIQRQADQMLKLIAEARSAYVS